MDLEAYIRECARPYKPAYCNCATAVIKALQDDPRARRMFNTWFRKRCAQRAKEHAHPLASMIRAARLAGFKRGTPRAGTVGFGVLVVHGARLLGLWSGRYWYVRVKRGAHKPIAPHVLAFWE